MTEQQKKMLEDALKVLNSVFNKKSDLIDNTAYATAKIEDVLALEEGEADEMDLFSERLKELRNSTK